MASMKKTWLATLAIAAPFAAREARAQDTATAPMVTTPAVATTVVVPVPVVATPARDTVDPPTDHDRFLGHLAVGYLGLSALPIASAAGTLGTTLSTPVIGVRYWLAHSILGIDAGVGFSNTSGSTSATNGTTTVSTDKPSQTGFAFHGGVPLALATGRHYTFEVIPELNVGFTSATIKGTGGNPDTSLSGFRFDLGARVGGEIHFGFIGVPELALQASVGLFLSRQSVKSSAGPNSSSDGTWSIGTSLVNDPWQIFAGNVAALYYF